MQSCPQGSGGAAPLFLTSALNGNLHTLADISVRTPPRYPKSRSVAKARANVDALEDIKPSCLFQQSTRFSAIQCLKSRLQLLLLDVLEWILLFFCFCFLFCALRILSYFSPKVFFRFSMLEIECFFFICVPNLARRFSIIFMSGDWVGVLITFVPLYKRHPLTKCEECFGSLSW